MQMRRPSSGTVAGCRGVGGYGIAGATDTVWVWDKEFSDEEKGSRGTSHGASQESEKDGEREINMPLTGPFWLASVSFTQQHMHTNVHISYTFPIHQDSL